MTKINFQNVHTMIGADASIEGPIVLNEGIIIYGIIDLILFFLHSTKASNIALHCIS